MAGRLSDRYLCIDGRTPTGRRLQVWADSSFRTSLGTIYPSSQAHEVHVLIDGAEWTVMRWDTMRDGGTQTIKLARRPDLIVEQATLTLPHRLSSPDRIPRLDGEDVLGLIPQDAYEDVLAWRIQERVKWLRLVAKVAKQESDCYPGVVDRPSEGYGLLQTTPTPNTHLPPLTPGENARMLAFHKAYRGGRYRGWRAHEIVRDVARRFGIPLGERVEDQPSPDERKP